MNNNPNQPKEYDVVLGGTVSPPMTGAVLGGIEGVKRRLASPIERERLVALSEALKYGEAGLDLLIRALKDNSAQVRHSASLLLLWEKTNLKVKQALLEHDPWLSFTTLADWEVENFKPQIGITETVGIAYAMRTFEMSWKQKQEVSKLFRILLQDPQASKLQALLFPFYSSIFSSSIFVEALVAAKTNLTSLKAVFIGDKHQDKYRASDVKLSNMSPLLKAYPKLEVLQVRGRGWGDGGLAFSPLRHECLKTLIVETGYMLSSQTIDQICALELPALEYLELWLGTNELDPSYLGNSEEYYSSESSTINSLMPIISGKVFPELKYLGLRNSDRSDAIALAIADSPIIEKLKILDLSMGTLRDTGAEALLNCPVINKLHTLNISMNLLSKDMIQKFSQIECRVVAQPQLEDESERSYHLYAAIE